MVELMVLRVGMSILPVHESPENGVVLLMKTFSLARHKRSIDSPTGSGLVDFMAKSDKEVMVRCVRSFDRASIPLCDTAVVPLFNSRDLYTNCFLSLKPTGTSRS